MSREYSKGDKNYTNQVLIIETDEPDNEIKGSKILRAGVVNGSAYVDLDPPNDKLKSELVSEIESIGTIKKLL